MRASRNLKLHKAVKSVAYAMMALILYVHSILEMKYRYRLQT